MGPNMIHLSKLALKHSFLAVVHRMWLPFRKEITMDQRNIQKLNLPRCCCSKLKEPMEHNCSWISHASRTYPFDNFLCYEPDILSGYLAVDRSLACQ